MIAVVDGQVHLAYSLDLEGDYEEILDILETAAIMVASAEQQEQSSQVH